MQHLILFGIFWGEAKIHVQFKWNKSELIFKEFDVCIKLQKKWEPLQSDPTQKFRENQFSLAAVALNKLMSVRHTINDKSLFRIENVNRK